MREYEKIETIYQRSTEGSKTLMPGVFRDPTVEMLKDINWIWTEKIDGTNTRVYWDGHTVTFGGRTEKATIVPALKTRLEELFCTNEAEEMFEQMFGEKEVILYGEGYGNKIQSVGKDYIADGVDFILFDVMIGNNYQARDNVESIAKAFGINVVPIIGEGTLAEAEMFVRSHSKSVMGSCDMEGLVCRPELELKDRVGKRIIVKIKWKDFERLVNND